MFVKKNQYKKREFKGVEILVGAIGEKMMVTLMLFKKGDHVGKHAHLNEQAGYCISGKFKLVIANEEYLVTTGDSYLIPENTEHEYEILRDYQAVEVFSPPREDYK